MFGSCIIHILYTECAKIKKKKFRRQKVKEIPRSCNLGVVTILLCVMEILSSNLGLETGCSREGGEIFQFWPRQLVQHFLSYRFLLIVVTYLLTAWSRVLLDELTGCQLVKKFPTFYGNQWFITAFTSARHLSLS